MLLSQYAGNNSLSLLLNDEVKKEVTGLISYFWSKAREEKQFGIKWELLKFEVGKFLRKSGSSKWAEGCNKDHLFIPYKPRHIIRGGEIGTSQFAS